MHHRLTKIIAALICVFFLSITSVIAQTSRPSFEEYALQRMQEHNVVGASIATIKDGHLDIFYLGFESDTSKIPTNKNSVFQVGSISKPISAWAAMTLVHAGKLDLDQPIQKYLTRWSIPASTFDIEQVTLRRLLSHTAGFRLGGYAGFPEGQALPTLVESLSGKTNGSGKVELFQEPGANFSYSGGGYTLIQLLIEEVSGMPFHDYVQRFVFTPLKMTESSYEPGADLLARRIQPHGFSRRPIAQHDFRAQAAASLHTTASDLAHFLKANLVENSVLGLNQIRVMHSPVANAGFAEVGLGFFISADGQLIGHGGANFGWRAEIQFKPQTKDGLIVMTNSEGAGQFLADIKCDWDSRHSQPLLSEQCSERLSLATLANKIVLIIATLMALAILVLVWAFLKSKIQFTCPKTGLRLIGLLLLAGLTLFFILFIYTPLGVYLFSGFNTIFATIHYAPPLVARLTPWVCGGLLLMWLPFFVKRTKN